MYKESVIKIKDLSKKFKGFELNIPSLDIPKGLQRHLLVRMVQVKVHL